MKEISLAILVLLGFFLWIAANIWFDCWLWKKVRGDDDEGRSLWTRPAPAGGSFPA